LYAQLESLNTTVAQQRRDAPRRAAKEYAAQLKKMIEEEEEEYENENENEGGKDADNDTEMGESANVLPQSNNENQNTTPGQEADGMDVDSTSGRTGSVQTGAQARLRRARGNHDPAWTLQVALGTKEEQERWKSGDIASVYEDALRMLLRLQGEGNVKEAGAEGHALATTVGKAERAGRAAEVVENMNN
jgi:kinetochor protein Mis14/NSL1